MHIGAAIRQVRETFRLKIEMVAADAGFDAGNLSRIETGRQNPSVPRLEAIARAMDVTVADLYSLVERPRWWVPKGKVLQEHPVGYAGDWARLQRHFQHLDERHRRLALEMIEALERSQWEEEVARQTLQPMKSSSVE